MKKYAAILMIFLFLTGCAGRQIQPTDSAMYYIPANIDIIVAEGLTVPKVLIPSIRQSMQEYIDDRSWWNKNAKPVNLLIKLTHLEEASVAGVAVVGLLAPPSKLMGELTFMDGEKKRVFPITATCKSTPFTALFGQDGLNQRLAPYFASEVMATVQRPFTD